jgi:L-ascorbate metabolism protein UlaG (beta-lactamase superfamily)
VHTDHLDGETLVPLAKAAGVRLVVPCHYEMFEFNTESPDEFARACEGLEQPFRVMQCWERIDLRSAKQDHLATA